MPYPDVVDPLNPDSLPLSPIQTDYLRLEDVLNAIQVPSIFEMFATFVDIKETLDDQDRGVYPLLQWIIGSNR